MKIYSVRRGLGVMHKPDARVYADTKSWLVPNYFVVGIELNDLDPIERFSYKVVAQGGRDASGNRVIKDEDLPIYLGSVRNSTIESIEYLIIASDLQGNVFEGDKTRITRRSFTGFLTTVI